MSTVKVIRRIARFGLAASLVSVAAIFALDVILRWGGGAPLSVLLTLLVINVVCCGVYFARIRFQIVGFNRSFVGGLAYGLAFLSPWILAIPSYIRYGLKGRISLSDVIRGFSDGDSGLLLIAALVGSFLVGWLVSGYEIILRRMLPPIAAGPRINCPDCDYSLVGNRSMKCPECGRAFTFKELGTTKAEFQKLSKATSRMIE
jgi:hypothetical protein